jgi:hypothetical protein
MAKTNSKMSMSECYRLGTALCPQDKLGKMQQAVTTAVYYLEETEFESLLV